MQCISEKLNGFKIIFEMVNNIKFELFTVCSGFDLLDPKSSMRVRHLKRGPCTIRKALQMKKKPSNGKKTYRLGSNIPPREISQNKFDGHYVQRRSLQSELLIPVSISVQCFFLFHEKIE